MRLPDIVGRISRVALVLSLTLLAACNNPGVTCLIEQCGAPPPADQPGSLSYYAEMNFNNQPIQFCDSESESWCTYDIRDHFATPLQQAGWTINTGLTSGLLNGSWTGPDATADQVAAEHPNLLYVFGHGSLVNGAPQACLRNCDGVTWGGDYSFGTQTLPSAWNGPNWLVLDTCWLVTQTTAWDPIFGGSLHGILGWDNEADYGIGDAGYAKFDQLVEGYDSAVDAWEQATRESNTPQYMAMLVPQANAADAIERAGGPHFGYNGETNPEYYFVLGDGSIGVASPMTLPNAPSAEYSLVGEQMDENYWYTYYGGSSVPSTITHPSANENLYRNQYVTVDHYLASGGVIVSAGRTGTAKGFPASDALQYALNWLQSNGGLPPDGLVRVSWTPR